MSVRWTQEQQQVISLRGRSILVSAAAGSGKTAVLVQRILSMIMDKHHPVDVDRLLIMTFTRAAAGEMRERLSDALEEALLEEPENEHLQRQMTLIHTAQITTIDGFCSYIIRNYFHLIGLDPGYRTGDEGELKLLQEDVLKNLLEDYYAQNTEKYRFFVECYAPGKSDDGIRDLIQELYRAAMSNPYPEEWLKKCLNSYEKCDEESLKNTKWVRLLWEAAKEELAEAKSLAQRAMGLCREPDGPGLYGEALASDLLFLDQLSLRAEARDYDGAAQLLANPGFARLSAKKMPDALEQKKGQVKRLRESEKAILKDLGSRYFSISWAETAEQLRCCRQPMETLVELTGEFIVRFGEAKREKNLLDFADMEHFALQILMTKDGNTYHMSQAARELSEKYEEVLVDEYQDSNLVQELLTVCVSGWARQKKNVFMVGDVKQSIYRFRLARPELFMEKYRRFTLEDSAEQRIDLHKNFRSRPEVLESVNYIFRQIMGENLGGIAYDDAAALYPGAEFPQGGDEEFLKTEVLLVEKDGEELADQQGAQKAQELEALAVAQRIREIVGTERVVDRRSGEYRPAEYKDIVVLLRTASGWAEVFSEVFSAEGIPSYTASKTGYFSALEVVTLLNYLRICDNPCQDIPLAGVLRSPIGGCTAQELATLRAKWPDGMLYDSLCACAGDGQLELFPKESGEAELKEKLGCFLEQLEEVRSMAQYTPVHQLILYVLDRTGYGNYARALPGGEQRSANLTMLVEKAMDYEKTSYRGLFNFIRYIEHLQKYQVDYGEVNLSGFEGNYVQIMTIHRSKGLEFPIVFAAGMGKQFNFRDLNAALLIHPELGVGADAILPDRRLLAPTLSKQLMRRELLKESLGEELRVLYVAMTRAKEKLILSGTMGKLAEKLNSLARFQTQEEELLSVGTWMSGKNYWSYILPALARHRCMTELFLEYDIPVDRSQRFYHEKAEFVVRKIGAAQMTQAEVCQQAGQQMKKEALRNWDCGKVYDSEIRRELEERFNFRYPYEYLKEIPVKVSVSDLKKRGWHDASEKEENLFFEPDIIPLIPRFAAEREEEYRGAARGTAYHRLMECLDYKRTGTREEIQAQIDELTERKKLETAEAQCISVEDVRAFLDSPLGERMRAAGTEGRLMREQPFVISRAARELNEAWACEEPVLIQGIIDAYFLEEDEIILVDYKTDHILPGEEKRLAEMYHVQLEDYAQALERMTGRRVKEKYIYSFAVNREILL